MAHEIRLPRLGWSMEEGVFVGWLKQPGDAVAVGEPLFEMESDKALQPVESIDDGLLFLPPDAPKPGTTVTVGALLGYLLAVGESAPSSGAVDEPPSSAPTNPSSTPASTMPRNASAGPAARRLARSLAVDLAQVVGTGKRGRIMCEDVAAMSRTVLTLTSNTSQAGVSTPIASPRARRIASELGVDWRSLRGTGGKGRIREADIRAAIATNFGHARGLPTNRRGIAISPRRKAIADRLRISRERTIPVTLNTVADATNLVALRTRYRTAGSEIVPAYTDVFAQLVAQTLVRHPQMSVRWEAGQEVLVSLDRDDIHIAIAVDTPEGLLAPVIRNVADKPLAAIARESQALIDTARRGRLVAAQMQDAAMTITNLGSYGVDSFTPIINYPEIAILGLGAIRWQPVVTDDGRVEPRQLITLSLTFDHAAIDGAPAAAFLRDLVLVVEGVEGLDDA